MRIVIGRDFFLRLPRQAVLREWNGCMVPADPVGGDEAEDFAPLQPV